VFGCDHLLPYEVFRIIYNPNDLREDPCGTVYKTSNIYNSSYLYSDAKIKMIMSFSITYCCIMHSGNLSYGAHMLHLVVLDPQLVEALLILYAPMSGFSFSYLIP